MHHRNLLTWACLAVLAAAPRLWATDDPFLWLEEVDSPRAMDWVRAENAKTVAVIDQDARFAARYRDALALAVAQDRIPKPEQLHGAIYNLWQDATHAHGLWRSVATGAYASGSPPWQPVLDLDALSKAEGANWFWQRATCEAPLEQRCILSLSDGGEDASTLREFDLATRGFVDGGFSLPRGKQFPAWQDRDHIWVSREWAPGELTASGYPYVVKSLARGASAQQAVEVWRGSREDMAVDPVAFDDGSGHHALLVRRYPTFFEVEYLLQGPRGLEALALPRKCEIIGLLDGRLVVEVREPWHAGGRDIPAGSLAAFTLARAQASPQDLSPELVYEPGARRAYAQAAITRTRLLVVELDNVRGRGWAYAPRHGGGWARRALPLPDNSTIDIASASVRDDTAYVQVDGFLSPSTLWQVDAAAATARVVKTLAPRFDATGLVVEQLEATSADGTRIPYFHVHRADAPRDGSTPTILYAYGGFQLSETPNYSGNLGKLWLERGGAFVLANIRGGGEFGPAWHEAGLKTKRQVIYDDFAAVARDLVARRLASPAHLGIRGGSNGGLLMGVEMTQHPELWSAVDIEVPLLDMLRFEQIAAGSSWTAEYGSVANPDERAFLASISPYHNLREGVAYPRPLIWSTTKDDRVGPQHARKFAARMGAMGLPYYYYEVIEGGHADGATPAEQAAMTAREYTYFAMQLGLE